MILLHNWDNFILEKFGRNDIAKNLSNKIINIINQNLGKLILNNKLEIKNEIGEIDGIKFINDEINIEISNRNYGNINPMSIIIENDSILNLKMNLEVILDKSEKTYKKISTKNKLIGTINHESLHIIERYLTFINENDFSKSWEMGEILDILKDEYKSSKNWYNDISYFIYLSLPHEMRDRLHQLNSEIKSNGIKDVMQYIKSSKIYKDVEFISNIDINKILNRLKLDIDYSLILKDFSSEFLKNDNKNYEKNLTDYLKRIKTKNKKLLDKLLRTSYNFESVSLPDKELDYEKYKK